ncbi:MAG TPA: chemotaxis protein CheA, partial [Pirellulales bacterium]
MSDDLSGLNLYDLFREEVESQAAQLVDGLLSIERTGRSGAAIEPLMRAAHSIKGAGRVVQAEAVVQTAHALEDALVAAQHGKLEIQPHHVDLFLRAVDVLVQIARLDEAEVPAWQTDHEAEITGLVAELGRAATEPPPSPNPAPSVSPAATAAPVEPAAPQESADETVAPTTPDRSSRADNSSAQEANRSAQPARGASTSAVVAASASSENEIGAELAESPAIEVKAKVSREIPAEEPNPQESADRVVRVAAQSLTRLVTLAGASVVEAQRLAPLTAAFDHVRREQIALLDILTSLEASAAFTDKLSPREQDQFYRAKTLATDGLAALSVHLESLDSQTRRHEDLSVRLHREVLASRMRPISDGLQGFPRLVRDLSRRLGKDVAFEVRGETTGVDRDLLELLDAPLNHLVRNSLDHGLETPEERRAAGKNPVGRIRIDAGHRAGWLQIVVGDDGRGIDAERVRRKIVEKGMTTAEIAARLTPAEVYDFLFLPGFTTTSEVTEISGRGVGLDVVLSRIRAVGGSVRIASHVGRGAAFHLQLPITTSVVRALLVRIAGEPYACPLARLERIARVPRTEIETIEGRPWWKLDGEAIGLADAAQVLELDGTPSKADALPIVVVGEHGRRYGIVVEEFLGERDLVVHPLDPRLGKVPNVNS